MTHAHSHRPGHDLGHTPRPVKLLLAAVIVPLVALTAVGLVSLWPSDDVPRAPEGFASERAHATVIDVHPCPGEARGCRSATVEVTRGAGAPRRAEAFMPFGAQAPDVRPGDEVLLSYVRQAPPGERYSFQDFDRTSPLLVLVALFVGGVLLLSRWRGFGSLGSLAFSLVLLVVFTLPALVQGGPPLPIAVVTAATIMVVTLYLSHGLNTRTTVAMVGTLLSLVVIGALGSVFTRLGRFTGLTDEGGQYIAAIAAQVDLSGLLLAGLVIGALGVLDDVTVTQASAVWELADADPQASRASLFARGMRIGRAHAASTVNTLALAYVGATLPLLLVFSAIELPFGSAISQELVAQEVVRGLVGGLGIVAAVPITTAIAAVVAATLIPSRDGEPAPASTS